MGAAYFKRKQQKSFMLLHWLVIVWFFNNFSLFMSQIVDGDVIWWEKWFLQTAPSFWGHSLRKNVFFSIITRVLFAWFETPSDFSPLSMSIFKSLLPKNPDETSRGREMSKIMLYVARFPCRSDDDWLVLCLPRSTWVHWRRYYSFKS